MLMEAWGKAGQNPAAESRSGRCAHLKGAIPPDNMAATKDSQRSAPDLLICVAGSEAG